MAKSITIRAIDRRAESAYIRVGKSEIEIPVGTADEFKAFVRAKFSEMDEEALLWLGLALWIARNPDLSNPAQIVGRTLTLDLQGRVNYPDSVVRVS